MNNTALRVAENTPFDKILNTLTDREFMLFIHLKRGKENAKTKDQLMAILDRNITERGVRLLVESMRNKGIPVISHSSWKGYWLPQTEEEKEGFAREQKARGAKCFKSADNVMNYDITTPDNYIQMELGI